MLGRSLFAAAAAATTVLAAPLEKRQNIDPTILNFALTLEHLENAFYKGAIQKFSQQDFMNAGYSATYYNNLKYIAFDEQTHVQLLQGALQQAGVTPVQPCTYNFPYTDVPSFITLSSVLEGVGTSAYLGAAPLVTSKNYLTVAGSILAVEALHTSYQRAAIGEVPMANPLYTPLDPMSVYTLAAMFIKSCPANNPPLPFQSFPSLIVKSTFGTCEEPDCDPSAAIKRDPEASPSDRKHRGGGGRHHDGGWYPGNNWDHNKNSKAAMAGTSVTFTAQKNIPAGSYVTFVSGLTVTSVKGTVNGMDIKATVPSAIMGQSYVFVSKSDVENTFDDSQVLFGPAVLEVAPPAPQLNFNQI